MESGLCRFLLFPFTLYRRNSADLCGSSTLYSRERERETRREKEDKSGEATRAAENGSGGVLREELAE